MSTTIAWVRNPDNVTQGATWNPALGCLRKSPGCERCYAERLAGTRLAHLPAYAGLTRRTGDGPRWTGKVGAIDPRVLAEPLRRRKPTGYFVDDMADLFLEARSDEDIAAVFGVMAACPQHRFYVLTKRAERMERWFGWVESEWRRERATHAGYNERGSAADIVCAAATSLGAKPTGALITASFHAPWPLPNVWLGTTAEDQARADERIPHLLRCPAAVRFLSVEPMLSDVLMGRWLDGTYNEAREAVDWVIVGGESGPKARPFDLAWARSLRDQCRAASVPWFFKQAGANACTTSREDWGKALNVWHGRASSDPAEWPEDLRVQEFPEAPDGR